MSKITIEQSVDKLKEVLNKDKEYYHSWQANIAMSYIDNEHWYCKKHDKKPSQLNKEDKHIIANNAAKHFLDLLIK